MHAVLAAHAVVGKRRGLAVTGRERLVVGSPDLQHLLARHLLGLRHSREEGRTRHLQIRQRGIPQVARDQVLDFDDLAVLYLQPQSELDRLVVLGHDAEETNLLRHRVGDVDLEGRRHRLRGLPQSFARLGRSQVLHELDVGGDRYLLRIVCDERGEISVDHAIEAIAVALFGFGGDGAVVGHADSEYCQ